MQLHSQKIKRLVEEYVELDRSTMPDYVVGFDAMTWEYQKQASMDNASVQVMKQLQKDLGL